MLAVWLGAPGVELTTCPEIEAAEALLTSMRFEVAIADLSPLLSTTTARDRRISTCCSTCGRNI
jgi:hypothetical protein